MAHFAKISENLTVLTVLAVSDDHEHRGQEYLADDLGLGGRWIQTSYNNNFRKQFAGINYTYNETGDVFVLPQPFNSWTVDENYDWQAPKPYPDDGLRYVWDEAEDEWMIVGNG
tara:strand:- start:341 stop:682 length:342 start_codon:yes stop_codon:yes gene_type:complete